MLTASATLVSLNRPFARSGHMVRNELCWDANDAVVVSRQTKVVREWYEFFYFGNPTALFASQHDPYHVTGSCKEPIVQQEIENV